MRLFIAAHLNKSVLDNVKELISPITNQYNEVKWVSVENIHVTLKFLGETDENDLNKIINALHAVEQSPFSLAIQKIGGFPQLSSPKVIWLGINGDLAQINQLFKQIDHTMANLGFPKEKRKYSPHLTIGRVRNKLSKPLLSYLNQNKDWDFGETNIDSFKLISSELTPKGPIYNVIQNFTLKL